MQQQSLFPRTAAIEQPLFETLPEQQRPVKTDLSFGTETSLEIHFRKVFEGDGHGLQEELGRRWARELRRSYPGRDTAKRIARDFDVSVAAANSWIAGQVPQLRFVARAVELHGPQFVLDVLLPETHFERRVLGPDEIAGQMRDALAKLMGER